MYKLKATSLILKKILIVIEKKVYQIYIKKKRFSLYFILCYAFFLISPNNGMKMKLKQEIPG